MRTSEGFELTNRPLALRVLAHDLWGSRHLVRLLSRKEFFVRYRRASLGLIWAVGLPVVQAVVLAIVFSRIVKIEVAGSYPVFVFAGLLPWSFFNGALSAGATSIVDGATFATKIYFPRAVLPLVTLGANFYGFGWGLVVLLGMNLALGDGISISVLYLVPGVVLMLLLSAAFALVLSALHVYFRDVRYIVQAAVLAWFYGTPIIYPLDYAPDTLRRVIEANPATGLVELFRAAVSQPDSRWQTSVWWTIGWTVALLAAAAILHRRFDRRFVDLL